VEERRIQLHSTSPPLSIPEDRVYYAFASGRLDYDCVSCGAQCCRGHGYALQSRVELEAQLSQSPAIAAFLRLKEPTQESSGHAGVVVKNCPPACFFLGQEGLCNIQTTQGYASKPETCRLFPFNDLRLFGGHLIVAPHASLCPLKVLPLEERSPRSSHASLNREMGQAGIGAHVQEAATGAEIEGIIRLERTIVALSERHLKGSSFLEFAEAQSTATHGLLRSREPSVVGLQPWAEHYCQLVADVLQLMPSKTSTSQADLLATMIGATPAVRVQLVFPLKRGNAPDLDVTRVPAYLCVLHSLAALALDAGMTRVTYQTIMRLCASHGALLRLLALADSVVVLRPDLKVDLRLLGSSEHHMTYVRILRALVSQEQEHRRSTLGEILCRELHETGFQRISLLSAIAQRLLGRISETPLDRKRSRRKIAFVPMIQRWVLREIKAELHVSVARTAARRGSRT